MNKTVDDFVSIVSENSKKMDELSNSDEKILRMMLKMGYKSGSGLGKSEQGITKSLNVSYQFGKKGLGMKLKNTASFTEPWNFSKEDVRVQENLEWLDNQVEYANFSKEKMSSWIKKGPASENKNVFCDQNVLKEVVQAKEIFDDFHLLELLHARSKANPFETLKSAFFMNRAALKIANIDAATDFMFSNVDENVHHNKDSPIYFADVCAGPGGFSEYILWRKKWYFKGFGLTLKDENDFDLQESTCASSAPFQALYGEEGDGNVCCPNNILDFQRKIMHETAGKGVHFMMSDGGFSVQGNENLQEILSKNIYICQCLVALEIVRTHGHFVTKMFDIFTPFSVGLVYLIYKCFAKVAIFKPNSSRPANAERYLICSDLNKGKQFKKIKSYLWVIVKKLWEMKDDKKQDILEIVPLDVIMQDKKFHNYIIESNKSLALKQIIGLKKLTSFCCHPYLTESRQEELRKKCLELWHIPDKGKESPQKISLDQILNSTMYRRELFLVQPRVITNLKDFNITTSEIDDWHYCGMCSSKEFRVFNFYVGTTSSKVYKLQWKKWVKIKNLQLCKGTILFGELVKEICQTKTDKSDASGEIQQDRFSLHVIDALQLGEIPLAHMKFEQRMELIRIYCKSVNSEFQDNAVRVRHKPIFRLASFKSENTFKKDDLSNKYISVLPTLGFNSSREHYHLNSVLFLKTNQSQSFQSTYVLRIQVFVTPLKDDDNGNISVGDIIKALKTR